MTQVGKELKDCLFLPIIIKKAIIKFLLVLIKNIFFQELKYKITISKLMIKIFMINSIKEYDKIRKISTGQGDDFATGYLLDFAYFEKNYKLIAVDLGKQNMMH